MTLRVATRVCGPDWRQALASTKAALLYADEVQYQEADNVLWADDGWRFDMRNVPFLIPLFFDPTNPPDLRTAQRQSLYGNWSGPRRRACCAAGA
jgi:hypothetical protein